MNLHTRRLVRAGTAMALCLALLCPLPVSAADLYFTATNDSLAQLTTDTMPLWSGGVLYVPYTVFDSRTNSTGIDLGVNASYSRSDSTVKLFTPRKFLVFDLNNGTCRDDLTGESYSARAIIRNGRPYLPVKTVCDFFGLTSSYSAISQAYLVRIKNDAVVLSDAKFIAAALSPAKVLSVETDPEGAKTCRVTEPDAQLSLAIGNRGQNARLAAKLTGWKIDIRPESGFYGEDEETPADDAEA